MDTERQQMLARHIAQSAEALPGPDYYAVLGWMHEALCPAVYLEIGIRAGASLALAQHSKRCVGIDPAPAITFPLTTGTEIYPTTSDEFFATVDRQTALQAGSIDFAFIDGLHLFEQALRDFIHLERWCSPRSVIAIHDSMPLDAETSTRTRNTDFYSGDVWKLPACLKLFRPDLQITTVKTGPTGLCLVTHLNPASNVLSASYDKIVEQYIDLPFEHYRSNPQEMPPLLNNVRDEVFAFLAR